MPARRPTPWWPSSPSGRTDADAFYSDRLDLAALRRELLAPLGPGGSGRILPRWWDATADRSARAGYLTPPDGAVLLLDGTLLGLGLPVELTMRLHLSARALQRATPPEQVYIGRRRRGRARIQAAARTARLRRSLVRLVPPVTQRRPASLGRV